jgi:cyclic beta-1,2-glucan synthetase
MDLKVKSALLSPRFPRFTRRVSPWDSDAPIREELFSVERLEAHARSLAIAQAVALRATRGLPLATRLADNGAVLLSAYREIVEATDDGRATTPAAEWLIDNYHLVESQIRQISMDMPPGYYRQLPKLVSGPFAGYPRVFGMAWAFVAHTDSSFDANMLVSFINAYQTIQPLMIGELWAASITLQIVLIENLRRLAQQITRSRLARHEADSIADRLLGVSGRDAEPASIVFADRAAGPLSDAFAVQLVHRLRDQDPKVTPALAWLDDRLSKREMTADAAVREGQRSHGAANVTMRNIVTSLRLIAEVDWTELFKQICLVDSALSLGGAFDEMDFATRTLYRTAVERLARGSRLSELEIARLAVTEARKPQASLAPLEQLRRGDPGYYLLAGGRPEFEKSIDFRKRLFWLAHATNSLSFCAYSAAIVVTSACLLAAPLMVLAGMGVGDGLLYLLALLGVVSAIDAGVALVNRGTAFFVCAVPLPGLELRDGVPESLRTLIAVPTLLTTVEDIAAHVERLEIHYLASPEGDLHFALLSDWADADAEHTDGDAELLAFARESIEGLNRRYGPAPEGPRFLLLHRKRVWNDSGSAGNASAANFTS